MRAAAHQQQHIDLGPPRRRGQHGGDAPRRFGTLDRHGVQDYRHVGRAAPQRGENVAQCRRLQGSDDADPVRQDRQRPLDGGVEQALGQEPLAQPQELLPQAARAKTPHELHRELEFPARLIERHCRGNLHLVAVAGRKIKLRVAAAEHHAAHLGAGILEREIPVTAGSACQRREFTAHALYAEPGLQGARNGAVQLGNCQANPRQFRVLGSGTSIHAG